MKFFAFALAAFVVVGFEASAQVPIGPNAIKLGKVQLAAPSTPEYQVTGGQNKRYEIKKWLEFEIPYDTTAEEIDELTFKFTVLFEKQLLDGEVTYVNIAKGKDHYAVMYMSPKSISKLTGGRPLSPTAVDNVWVEVSRSGQVLAKEALKAGAQPNVVRKTGMIVPKNVTPFAPLFYDRYEEIKAGR